MKFLFFRRCTFDIKDDSDRTFLYDATRRNTNDSVHMLVNAGADLDYEEKSGRTPLDRAVHTEKPVLVRLLLTRGARMKLCSYRKQHYEILLAFALSLSSEEVVRVLFEFYARGMGEESISPLTALNVVLDKQPELMPVLLETWPETKEFLRTHSERPRSSTR